MGFMEMIKTFLSPAGAAARPGGRTYVVDAARLVDEKTGRRMAPREQVQMLNALARIAKQESLEIQVLFESDRPLREVDEGGEFNGLKVYYAPDTEQLVAKALKLCRLKAVGLQTGWMLSHEVFGWRRFRNRKAVGSFAGLTGTPYDSGETLREQGISKAGSSRVRTAMIELAWSWVRYQPGSALTRWFFTHYVAAGTSRSKRTGIVALARKLLVALWKYVEQDVVPEGALLKA